MKCVQNFGWVISSTTYTKYYHYLQTYSEFSLQEQVSFIKILLLAVSGRGLQMWHLAPKSHNINTKKFIFSAQSQNVHVAKRSKLSTLVFTLAWDILTPQQPEVYRCWKDLDVWENLHVSRCAFLYLVLLCV